jgi:hypothetical protein
MFSLQLKSLITFIIILLHVYVVLSQDTNQFNDNNINNNSYGSSIVKSTLPPKKVTTYRSYTRSAIAAVPTSSAVSTASTNNISSDNSIPNIQYENKTDNIRYENQTDINNVQVPVVSFKDFLQSINFVFIEPKENATIYQNQYLDVKWECNQIDKEIIPYRNISVVLENQKDQKGYYIEIGIDLNQKQGKYYIGSLDEISRDYALWLATGNGTDINYFRGPSVVNGNSKVVNTQPNVSDTANDAKKDKGGFFGLKTYILLFFVVLILVTMMVYLIVIAFKNKRKETNERDYKEYQEYKGYTNVSPSINKLLGLDELYEKENKKNTQRQMMSNSTNSIQSINTLAEQLYKAEQVYNNKVLKNSNLNDNHCAPLVDMSNLYKQSQEITQVNTDDDYNHENQYYKSRILNTNKDKAQKSIMKGKNPYGCGNNSEVNKNEEESFLVFDENIMNEKNKYNNNFGRSDSVNSNKILVQSESFLTENDNSKNDLSLQKPFNIYDNNNNNNNSNNNNNNDNDKLDEINTIDEDYINKNSFCLDSKDSIDNFENLYLNKQNVNDVDVKESKKTSPLVATITTVEEYLQAHRNSLREQRLVRSSSLLTSSSASSSINSIVVSSALNNLPKMIGNSNQATTTSSSSPLKNNDNKEKNKDNNDNNNEKENNSEKLDNNKSDENKNSDKINQENKRVSESDYNSSSIVVDSSLNSSILEELNSLEKQIQQQRQQQLYRLQQRTSENYQPNSMDLEQLNLQIANLRQQIADNDPVLQSLPNDVDGYKYNDNNVLSQQNQSKGLSNYRSNIPPPQSKSISPVQSILKNRASPQSATTLYSKSPPGGKMTKILPDSLLQKSQESEATLQAQQNTQDTLPLDDNEDEAETIVATHVCNAYYYPNMPDELQMCPGDELIILEKFNDGWGFGQNTKGDLGVFPLDCVSYIDFNDRINNSGSMEISPVHTYSHNVNNNKTTLIQSKVPNISMSDSYDSYSNLSIKPDYLMDSKQDYSYKENMRPNQNVLYDNNDAYCNNNRKVYDDVNDIYTYRSNSTSSNNSNIYQFYSSMHQQMQSPVHQQIRQQRYSPIKQQLYSPNHQQGYVQYSSTTSPKNKNSQGRTNNVRFGNTQPPIHYY